MREAQIYILKHSKQKKITLSWEGGGCLSTSWGRYPPPPMT